MSKVAVENLKAEYQTLNIEVQKFHDDVQRSKDAGCSLKL